MAIKSAQRYRADSSVEKADRNQERGEEEAWDSIDKGCQITKNQGLAPINKYWHEETYFDCKSIDGQFAYEEGFWTSNK